MGETRNVREVDISSDDRRWSSDAEELRRYFLEYESSIGFKSTFSAMAAAMAGIRADGGPINQDPYADVLDRISFGSMVYRALKRMNDRGERALVVALWRMYGPGNRFTDRSAAFGGDQLAVYASRLAAHTQTADKLSHCVLGESSSEATVRWVLSSPPPGTPKSECNERRDARSAFVTSVRLETNQIRREAHEAYRRARKATA